MTEIEHAVPSGARHLHNRHVELAEKAEPNELRHLAQMNVDVVHLAGIDTLAAGGSD